MYEKNNATVNELVEIGNLLSILQRSINELDESVDICKKRLASSTGIKEMILNNALRQFKEQRINLVNRKDKLLSRRNEIIESFNNQQVAECQEIWDHLDNIIAHLLEVDDAYMEKHKKSNESIMLFIEKLLIHKHKTMEA